jgi:hypothetical protein
MIQQSKAEPIRPMTRRRSSYGREEDILGTTKKIFSIQISKYLQKKTEP